MSPIAEAFDAGRKGLVDDIALNHQVFVNEIRGVGVIGVDAANFCCGKDHHVGPLRLHEVPDGELVGQDPAPHGCG